jgi:hypothetical protein
MAWPKGKRQAHWMNLKGRRFERLFVIEEAPPRKSDGAVRWRCHCDCGRETVVSTANLVHHRTSSCGCLMREVSSQRIREVRPWERCVTHGATKTPEYLAWKGMRRRCVATRGENFRLYAGRGIRVAPEWQHDFAAFLAHIGPRPSSEHSLDRIDNNGNYEPGNVRWATAEEQCSNQRKTQIVLIDGDIPMTLAQIARAMEINWMTAKRLYGHLLVKRPQRKETFYAANRPRTIRN